MDATTTSVSARRRKRISLRGRGRGSSNHVVTCEQLLQHCKHEAKQLLETTATARKIHWSHPNFISFCLSVENILSYGVQKQFVSSSFSSRQPLTSSGRVLHELSKVFPVARSIYQMCYGENVANKIKPEYARFHGDVVSERKIIWIRASLVEKTMSAIIDQLLKKPELYYKRKSIMCHPVYSELFAFLMEGPCSLQFSKMKSIDSSILTPGPTELVSRHNKVIPSAADATVMSQGDTPSSEMWEHVQSLYQSSANACLYGKNNILMHPPGLLEPLQGYLTLVEVGDTYYIKWLPNTLINGSGLVWTHVLSVNVTHDVAHIHCHQGEGGGEGEGTRPTPNHSELIMIGYNGIAYPSLNFPQPSSMLSFLDALESALHPRGCLEPPLWFLRQQYFNNKTSGLSSTIKNIAVHGTPTNATPPDELWEFPPLWSQVFRIRFTKQIEQNDFDQSEWMENDILTNSFPRSSISPPPIQSVAMETLFTHSRGGSRKHLMERFQSSVSSQLLARYFYSWLSYCRHISKVKKSLSHLVYHSPSLLSPSPLSPPPSLPPLHGTSDHVKPLCLDKTLWAEFLEKKDVETWDKVLHAVYKGGMEMSLRKEVWPYLLKLYSAPSLNYENLQADKEHSINKPEKGEEEKYDYHTIYTTWRTLEYYHYKNNDPTSTSMEVRQGFTPPLGNDIHEITPPTVPDMIVLDDESDHVILNGDHVINSSDDSGCEDLLTIAERPRTGSSDNELRLHPLRGRCSTEEERESEEGEELSKQEKDFLEELFKIDKDIPRCDRDYEFFRNTANLSKLRNIISSYVWVNISSGYSQGMCDLLAPLLVILQDEELTFNCFVKLMNDMDKCFPPKPGVTQRMSNLQSLLQVLEGDFFQYLIEKPMGDALFYTYRWFLVNFKREFTYNDIFLLWETTWAAKFLTTEHFEVFIAFALLQEFKAPIMDAQLDPSEMLNLFTDLADNKMFNVHKAISVAHNTIEVLQGAV